MKRTFEVNGKFFNFSGRNIYKGYSIKLKKKQHSPSSEITGYGVSKSSEEIDRLEKNPMNKLQEKLSKLDLKF